MASPGSLGFQQLATSPPTPPVGFCIIYAKTDNILYLKDSSGVEIPLGSAASITQLTGDVTAVGPGSVAATVAFVGGKTALEIQQSVNDTQAATILATPSTIVKRDAFGAVTVNGLNSSDSVVITDNSPAALVVDGDVFVVDGTNNRVGINKLNPTEALDVVGNGNFSGNVVIVGNVSAANLTGSNTGDVTVTDSSSIDLTLVGQNITADLIAVGTKSIAEVEQSVDDTQDATDLNTASTIVKRDASGNFSAGTITANLTGNVNGVDPANHGSRHLPDNADALTTGAPVQINADGVNDVGTANSFSRADHKHDVLVGTPVQVGNANFAGASASLARADHVHNHGNQVDPNQHAVATTSANGFMSAADKTKLDNATPNNTPDTIVQRDPSGNFNASTVSQSTAQIRGASNNVNITANPGVDYNLVLPSTQGATGTYLSNDGSGNLSWTSPIVNIDGGTHDSVYVVGLNINGGTP